MEAVTGSVELKSKDTSAIEQFVKEKLGALDGHEIVIRRTNSGWYVATIYSAKEPAN
jgi:hypothetical protein